MKMYATVLEKTSTGWSAYVSDLPGSGVAGTSYSETEQLIREGIGLHIEDLRADGDAVTESLARAMTLPISA